MYVAGIDAGQSSTVAAIADEHGVIRGFGYAGPADEIGAHADSTRLRDALEAALANALRNAGLPEATPLHAVVAGISGYEGRIYGHMPRFDAQHVRLVHDAVIAHAGALNGEHGMVVIAGTGSAAYATFQDGRTRTGGGWGYLFGDEGSAFWIVRTALELAIAHGDCEATARILSFFDVHTLREVVRAFYAGEISRASLASFAPVCIQASRERDGCSCLCDPPERAAVELAALAERTAGDGAIERVAYVGGLVADRWFASRVAVATQARMPGAEIVDAHGSPVHGAVLMASRL